MGQYFVNERLYKSPSVDVQVEKNREQRRRYGVWRSTPPKKQNKTKKNHKRFSLTWLTVVNEHSAMFKTN